MESRVGGIEDRKANRKCETACGRKMEVQDRSSQGTKGKTACGGKGMRDYLGEGKECGFDERSRTLQRDAGQKGRGGF